MKCWKWSFVLILGLVLAACAPAPQAVSDPSESIQEIATPANPTPSEVGPVESTPEQGGASGGSVWVRYGVVSEVLQGQQISGRVSVANESQALNGQQVSGRIRLGSF